MVVFQILNTALKSLLVVLCVIALIKLFLNGKNKSYKFRNGWRYLRSKIAWILIFSMLFCGAFCMSEYSVNSRLDSVSFKFNYEEAALGQNPNGTRFNESKILSEEVLDKVIAKNGYDITVDELTDCLELSSSFDSQSVNQNKLNIATEYKVICNSNILNTGIDSRELLKALAEVYTENYIAEYSENLSVLDLRFDDLDQVDYQDVADYFDKSAERLNYCLTTYSWKDSAFRSENGETFASMAEKVSNFQNVDLERYKAFALEHGLSKDKYAYTTRMDYTNLELNQDYLKEMAKYNVRLEAIEFYDEQMARIVLIPSTDRELEYYMSRTKIGVDYFADQADTALANATKLQNEIQNNSYASAQVAAKNGTAYKADADAMIEALQTELLSLAEQTRNLLNSYIASTRNGYVKVSYSEPSALSLMNISGAVVYTVLFAAAAAGCAVVFHMGNQPDRKTGKDKVKA